jgi:integrase
MPAVKLSDRTIRDLKHPKVGGKDVWYSAGVKGLYLRHRYPGGSKVFVLRRQVQGRNLVEAIGEWGDTSMLLADAQREALVRRGEIKPEGKHTVADLADRFYKSRIEPRYKRPERVKHYLVRDLGDIGQREVGKVRQADLARILERKAKKSGPVAANRLLAIVRSMFKYGVVVGLVGKDPAAALTRAVAGGKERARERTLDDHEIRGLWGVDCDHGDLLRFLLLSGQRIGEAQNAVWADFDLDDGVWNITENKSSRPHVCPISTAMREILDRRADLKPGPFATASTTAAQAWLKRYCKREGIEPAFTPHDLRRTCASRMRKLGVSFDTIELHLNHKIAGVGAVYQRDDLMAERAAAVERWGAAVLAMVTPS